MVVIILLIHFFGWKLLCPSSPLLRHEVTQDSNGVVEVPRFGATTQYRHQLVVVKAKVICPKVKFIIVIYKEKFEYVSIKTKFAIDS